MAFEVRKGRSCDSLQVLNERLIESQGIQLMNYDKALNLSESKSTTLENLLSNSKEQGRVDKMQADLDKKVLKDKVKKRTILIIGETILIVILLL